MDVDFVSLGFGIRISILSIPVHAKALSVSVPPINRTPTVLHDKKYTVVSIAFLLKSETSGGYKKKGQGTTVASKHFIMRSLVIIVFVVLVSERCSAQMDGKCSEELIVEKAALNALKGPAEVLGGALQKVGGVAGKFHLEIIIRKSMARLIFLLSCTCHVRYYVKLIG